jgi:hypothetical protein
MRFKLSVIFFILLLHFQDTFALEVVEKQNPLSQEPRFAIAAEGGFNSLASILGVTATYYPTSRVALDFGLGYGVTGLKPGTRVRYFLLGGNIVRPYLGAAVKYVPGLDSTSATYGNYSPEGIRTETKYPLRVSSSIFIDGVGGCEFRFRRLRWNIGTGWSQQLSGRSWKEISAQIFPEDDRAYVDIAFGSGLTLYTSVGFVCSRDEKIHLAS